MTFVTPALLAGALLVGLPIVLHLVMRRRPQRLIFPALRFVQNRRSANQTRLRLRHLLLLLLRCGLILFLAIALARPTIRGSGRLGGQDAPIAAAVVINNSPRMEYRQKNHTRLQRAKEMVAWLLDELPIDTPVAVVARGDRYRGFAADRGAAQLRTARLTTSAVTVPLDQAIADALDLLEQKKEDYRGEVFVVTDMAQVDWKPKALDAFAQQLERLPEVSVYIIDVGAEEPTNVGIGQLQLSADFLTEGTTLDIEARLVPTLPPASTSPQPPQRVALYLENHVKQEDQKRGEKLVELAGNADQVVRFSLDNLPLGTHQGYVRIDGNDPLVIDNTRYFTVEVWSPRRVLIAAENPESAVFLREALAPQDLPLRFECDVQLMADLEGFPLDNYKAVCLLDPTKLSPVLWESLADFVQQGGGLGLFLGRNARRGQLGESAPPQLLAGPLRWTSRNETFLRPVLFDHPLLNPLAAYTQSIPWSLFPVFKFWEFDKLADGAHVICSFANGDPAIVERNVGKGRVLTMTTPISDVAYRDPWNLLPTGPDAWPFIVLAGGMADYLSGAHDDLLNYQAGQNVVMRLAVPQQTNNYVLRLPTGESLRQSLAAASNDALITATSELGNYRLQAGGKQAVLDRGFSVNAASEISEVQRIPFAEIQQALGKDRVQFAQTTDEIEIKVGLGRVGRELFPWLIGAVALVLGAEHLLANRFYRSDFSQN